MFFIAIIIFLLLLIYFSKQNNSKRSTSPSVPISKNIQPVKNSNITNKEKPIIVNYVGQTIFLNWASEKTVMSNSCYPKYFYSNYGIIDCNTFHNDMIKKGFLEKANLEKTLSTKTLVELKEILQKNNLKKSGNKPEIITRIIDNIDPEKIEVENEIYILSEKGKEYIAKYQYILDIKDTSISVEEFEKEREILSPKFSNRDVIWAIYNKYCLKLFYEKNFGLYRNNFFEMALFLDKEKRYKESLEHYLKVLCCDLSGMGNDNVIEEKSMLFIAPGIIKKVLELKKFFSKEIASRAYKTTTLPFNYCNEMIFLKIVDEIMKGTGETEIFNKYLSKMKEKPTTEIL